MSNRIETIVRVILGIALVTFGLDKFFAFVPHGHEMTEQLMAAYKGLMANKFILPTVGVVETLTGILLISGRYVIIALTALIPVIYGIIAFHFAVDMPGIIPGLIVAVMHLYLVLNRRSVFADLIKQTKTA